MALATQCPMCETVFRITTSQAAAKSGTVRCGHCFSVFNALDVLVRVEDLEFDRDSAFVAASPVASERPVHDPHEPDEVEPSVEPSAEPSVASGVEPSDDSPPSPGPSESLEPAGSTQPLREWWVPAAGESIVTSPPVPVREAPAETSLADRRLHVGWTETRSETSTLGEDPLDTPRRSRAERIALSVVSVVALVALLGQMAYAWRDELSARWPASRPALDALCSTVGCKVQYPMHVEAITIESTNVEATAPNSTTFVLTTLLRNRDSVDVRLPSLALTLTDAQDGPILRRVLRPEDYLPPDRLSRGFPAGSELPVRVAFEISELRFVGYRLDRFYP